MKQKKTKKDCDWVIYIYSKYSASMGHLSHSALNMCRITINTFIIWLYRKKLISLQRVYFTIKDHETERISTLFSVLFSFNLFYFCIVLVFDISKYTWNICLWCPNLYIKLDSCHWHLPYQSNIKQIKIKGKR